MSKTADNELSASCLGCKYLYLRGTGYSDWTWLDTYVQCAQDKNPKLKERDDSNEAGMEVEEMLQEVNLKNAIKAQRWLPIAGMRCEDYAQGHLVTVTPDGNVQSRFHDEEQRDAIVKAADIDPEHSEFVSGFCAEDWG